MVTMDLKGITWVGHVYQKFEAMCLEVEEVLYQDTVKYVENQVQTVGASVKKFYADVVQDLTPPSMDLVKGAATSDLPIEQYTDIGIYKKPEASKKEETVMVDHRQSDDSHATFDLDKDASHVPSFHGFDIDDTSFQPYSGDTVQGACSDSYSKQYGNRSRCKSRLGVKKKSNRDNFSLREMFGTVTHIEKDHSETLLFSELSDENKKSFCDQRGISPTPDMVGVNGCNCTEAISDEFENSSKGPTSVVADGQGCNEIEMAGAHSSCDDISAEINGLADDSTADTSEINIPVQQDLGIIQQVDDIQDEENCVLENGDGLHFVPHKESKHRPYKKKIRDVISSRMRSRRKHEYEQHATWYGEKVNSNKKCAGSSMQINIEGEMKRSAPQKNPIESDWELI
ncbi:uncharacterized protein LOC123196468 isoform X2 [Mangifera indica]|uniref:uncharacterized protein LOC123196468 isoform X2 n=1 Tax=Mangifera indica TaxID=29780 RepID=UPI001CFA3ED1|nr:uncharacterized protein LOC123196468 isoform X2 [Mangifera indica]